MNADAKTWFSYAEENLAVSQWALENDYYNACLQNVQQAVEKYLKAVLVSQDAAFQKTHSIETLNQCLTDAGLETGLSDEECELLDTIYIPSKYPMHSVLADFTPDYTIARQCVEIAIKVQCALQPYINQKKNGET